MIHQLVSVVSQCSLMPGCRTSLRRSALEALRDDALYKYTFTTLYFTYCSENTHKRMVYYQHITEAPRPKFSVTSEGVVLNRWGLLPPPELLGKSNTDYHITGKLL